MTLDTYADLFDDDLDAVAEDDVHPRLDAGLVDRLLHVQHAPVTGWDFRVYHRAAALYRQGLPKLFVVADG